MRTACALSVLLLSVTPVIAQEAVTLKWTLKEGTTFYAKNVMDMDMQMMVMGQSIDFKMKISTVQRFKVLSEKPGATTVEMTMITMDMSAEGLPGGIPGLGELGDRVKGAKLTAVLDEKMAVKKLEGHDEFLKKLAGDDAAVLQQMKSQFSESAVSQMYGQVFSFAPDKPVKVGESWARTDKLPAAGFEAAVKQKYKLDSVKDGVAKIGVTGDMSFKLGDGLPGLPPGVDVTKFDMKAEKYSGTLMFDTEKGRLTANTVDMDINGEMTISAGGQKVDMTMKIKGKQTTKVTDRNPVTD